MRAFSLNFRISAVFFLLFVLISHLLLPFFERSDWFVFSNWRVYALDSKISIFDFSFDNNENFYLREKALHFYGLKKTSFGCIEKMSLEWREKFSWALFSDDVVSLKKLLNYEFFEKCQCKKARIYRLQSSYGDWVAGKKGVREVKKDLVFEKDGGP